ncbi:MAG: DUF3298 domain-containing protein [Nitratireductor sp.]
MKFATGMTAILAALFLTAGSARAASFDCDKASGLRETAICKTDDLSTDDEIMAALYAGARARISADAVKELRDSQVSWLRFLDKACPQKDVEKQAACLKPYYRGRLKFLSHTVTEKAGRTFLTLDEWTFIAPEKKGEAEMPGANQMQYREDVSFAIDKPASDGERAFNALVAKQSDLWNGFDGDVQRSTWFTLNEATENFASLDIFRWEFHVGAAHGFGAAKHVNYRLDEARPLQVKDIFAKKDGWQKTLARHALDGLHKIVGEDNGLFDGAEETIAKMVGDPKNWVVTREGLGVNFPVYSVGPYAMGDHTVTTPWKDLAPWLAKDAVIGAQ